jgi:hypothetical protein
VPVECTSIERQRLRDGDGKPRSQQVEPSLLSEGSGRISGLAATYVALTLGASAESTTGRAGSVRRPKKGNLFFNFLQFRTIEVTALEKRQRDFENASLAGFEFKLFATLRCRTDR